MDGVTHVNIYSKGRTSLGQALSNFSWTPVDTVDGHFWSIEAYWYWLGSNHKDKEKLRYTYGPQAKVLGRELRSQDWNDEPLFKLKIYNAMLSKLIQHNTIRSEFLNNKLPFRHYYIFCGKICEPEDGKWIIEMWEFIRSKLCTS